jgi:membrane associated rhomboid family serine protease
MGESERYLDRNIKRISIGDDKNALMALITINAIIFLSLGLIEVIYYMIGSTSVAYQYQILRFFILPAKLSTLAVMPWTLLSYMFVHTGIIHILVTMLWLWVFGSIFQTISDNSKIIPLYIYGGFAGAIIFIGVNYMLPNLRSEIDYSSMAGSNAAVMALAIAATTVAPNYRLFRMLNGGIPLWVLTIAYVIIDVAGSGNTADHLAHLGGGLTGYLLIISLRKGFDWSSWMNDFYSWFMNLFNPDKNLNKEPKIKDKVFYNAGNRPPYYKRPEVTQQRIDQILDRINQTGYDRLTEEEKSILKKAGESEL